MPVLLYYGIISRALLKMSMSRKKIFACFDLKKKKSKQKRDTTKQFCFSVIQKHEKKRHEEHAHLSGEQMKLGKS